MDPSPRGRDVKLLDASALIMGAAIASLHVLRTMKTGLTGAGWLMVLIMFGWVAITATGPFIFLARRYLRHVDGYPRVGDVLWGVLGLPWILTAILRSALSGQDSGANPMSATTPLFAATLSIGLAVACAIALGYLWRHWVMVPAEQAALLEAGPWTNRVGLILAIAWPIQCGLGMVVLG